MEESIIRALYYGKLHPSGRPIIEGSAYQKAQHKLVDSMDEFENSLTAEQKTAFEQLQTEWNNLTSIASEDSFALGFQMGGEIILEITQPENRKPK